MATLFDRIKENTRAVKAGSQLFEAAPEATSTLVKKQGLVPGAVVSPAAAQGVGLSPEQAKMAGSPNQLANAIRESLAPGRVTPERLPTRQLATGEEQAAKAKKEQLRGLEGLGSRVSGIVNEAIKQASIAAPAQGIKQTFKADSFATDYPALAGKSALVKAAIETGKIDPGLLSPDVLTAFGITLGTGPDAAATASKALVSKLAAYTEAPKITIATQLANTLGPDVKLGELVNITPEGSTVSAWNELDMDTVANALGVLPEELKGLTVSELQDRLNKLFAGNYMEVDRLSRIANDPYYPENVRTDARKQLRELSSVGVVATEADMEALNQAVQKADTFTIGNREYTVSELLSDAGLNGIVTAFLTNPDYAKQIETDMPELAAFINSNKKALEAITATMGAEATKLADVAVTNNKLRNIDGVDLTEFNKLAIPDYNPDAPTATAYQPSAAHNLLLNDTGVSAADQEAWNTLKPTYARFLADLAAISPDSDRAKEFASKSYSELREMYRTSGYAEPFAQGFSRYLKDYSNYQKDMRTIANAADDASAIETTVGGLPELKSFFNDYRLRGEFGLPQISGEYKGLYDILDANGDGQMDDAKTIRAALTSYYGNAFGAGQPRLTELFAKAKAAQTAESSDAVYQAVKDGLLDEAELDSLLSQPTSAMLGTLSKIINSKSGLVTTKGETTNKFASAEQRALERELGPASYKYISTDVNTLNSAFDQELAALPTEKGAKETINGFSFTPTKYTAEARQQLTNKIAEYDNELNKLNATYAKAGTDTQRVALERAIDVVSRLRYKASQALKLGGPGKATPSFQGIRG